MFEDIINFLTCHSTAEYSLVLIGLLMILRLALVRGCLTLASNDYPLPPPSGKSQSKKNGAIEAAAIEAARGPGGWF